MEAHEVLEQVKSGKMTVEEAEQFFKREPFEEMGYAKIDSHRKMRSGFAEVIFCQGKQDEFLLEIFQRIYKDEGEVMGTRASLAQYELLHKELPQVTYDPVSRILKIEKKDKIAIRENKRDKIFLWNRLESGCSCCYGLKKSSHHFLSRFQISERPCMIPVQQEDQKCPACDQDYCRRQYQFGMKGKSADKIFSGSFSSQQILHMLDHFPPDGEAKSAQDN